MQAGQSQERSGRGQRKPNDQPLAAGVLVIALLHFAQSIFVPLAFSLFIIALVWPIQAALQRRMPQLLALLVTLIITIIVIVAVGSSIAWGFGQLDQWLFVNAGRFQAIYSDWANWREEHGIIELARHNLAEARVAKPR